jgi:uncharacterized membrane protein
MMHKYFIAYISTAAVFLLVDFVWLSKIARNLYTSALGDLLLDRPNMVAAAGFYTVYVTGIVFFAVSPAIKNGSALTALAHGGLFGFFAYATYDMTNYATLRNWPLGITTIDIIWGSVLTGFSAWAGYMIQRAVLGE